MSIIFKYILIFLVSMVPFVELKGAVHIAYGLGLNELISCILAIIGSIIPIPLVYLLVRKILNVCKNVKKIGRVSNCILNKGERIGKKVESKLGIFTYIILFIFVGIPLPVFGPWLGTVGCSLLKLNYKKSILTIVASILITGIIMIAISFRILEVI